MSTKWDDPRLEVIVSAIFWRFMPLQVVASGAAGFVVGFLFDAVWEFTNLSAGGLRGAAPPGWLQVATSVVTIIASLVLGNFILKWAIRGRLDRETQGVRLALIGPSGGQSL
jgi:hypothetical protein